MSRERRVCAVEGCDGRAVGRGYCSMHYQRWMKYGDPHVVKVQRSRWKWSERDLFQLDDLIAQGFSDAQIAKRLGATVNGIRLARKRHGIRSRTEQLMTARRVAALMGVGCAKSISRWIEHGWLKGRRIQRRGQHRQWAVTESNLWAFMEDPAHWHRWDPNRITDRHLREWALELRQGVRFLTLPEVAQRFYVEPRTVAQWIDKGWLPAVRNGNRLIRESDLVGFVRPIERDLTRIGRMQRAGATWEEIPAPAPFRRVRVLRSRSA